jgi:hypothetical protein
MWGYAGKALLGIGVVAGCLGATYAAATLALQRPDAFHIDAALASQLDADYSSDDYAQDARPPLNPDVIDAARTDERALDAGTDNAPASPVEPAATAVPQNQGQSPIAPAATSTPRPLGTNTPTAVPGPTDTPEPRPTNTTIPSPTMTPRPVTCGGSIPGLDGGNNDKCRTGTPSVTPQPTNTPTITPVPPTNTPTNTATPRPVLGCIIPGLPLLGAGDKCNTHTPTPAAAESP